MNNGSNLQLASLSVSNVADDARDDEATDSRALDTCAMAAPKHFFYSDLVKISEKSTWFCNDAPIRTINTIGREIYLNPKEQRRKRLHPCPRSIGRL